MSKTETTGYSGETRSEFDASGATSNAAFSSGEIAKSYNGGGEREREETKVRARTRTRAR